VVCPRPGGQRVRRADDPHAEGAVAVGADVRDRGGAAPGAAGVAEGVQRALDGGPARPPQPGTGAPGSPRHDAAHGGVNYALRRVQEIGSGSPAHWRQRLGRFREVPLWNAGLVVNALRAEPSTVVFSPSTLMSQRPVPANASI